MEYTKDIVLHVNYGQGPKVEKQGTKLLNRIVWTIKKHKIITTIIAITIMLMVLDFILINSFIQVLGSIQLYK